MVGGGGLVGTEGSGGREGEEEGEGNEGGEFHGEEVRADWFSLLLVVVLAMEICYDDSIGRGLRCAWRAESSAVMGSCDVE